MQDDEDDCPPTPRVCEACGGEEAACMWCSGGFQNEAQHRAWARHRRKMRRMSASYDFLEDTVEHTLGELNALDGHAAAELAARGAVLLADWRTADPTGDGRRGAAESLTAWQRAAIAYLRGRK